VPSFQKKTSPIGGIALTGGIIPPPLPIEGERRAPARPGVRDTGTVAVLRCHVIEVRQAGVQGIRAVRHSGGSAGRALIGAKKCTPGMIQNEGGKIRGFVKPNGGKDTREN